MPKRALTLEQLTSMATAVEYRTAPALRVADIQRDFKSLLAASPGRVLRMPESRPLMGVAAVYQGLPVGLILLQELVPAKRLHLPVWAVASRLRGHGIGRRLLNEAERLARDQGYGFVQLGFEDAWPGAPAVRQLLASTDWEPPVELLRHFRFEQSNYQEPAWLTEYPLPADYEVVPWGKLSAAELAQVARRGEGEAWYPEALSPFQDSERLEPLNSLALRRGGQVVGWMITHRLRPELIRYTALFVSPELTVLGRGANLFLYAWQRQLAAGIPQAVTDVQTDNRMALKFLQRRLAPWIEHSGSYHQSQKDLQPG